MFPRTTTLILIVFCVLLGLIGGVMFFRSVNAPNIARQPNVRQMRDANVIFLVTSLCIAFLIFAVRT